MRKTRMKCDIVAMCSGYQEQKTRRSLYGKWFAIPKRTEDGEDGVEKNNLWIWIEPPGRLKFQL